MRSMRHVQEPKTVEDLARMLDDLSNDVKQLRGARPLSMQDVQRLGGSLTRVQLVLNELERIEIGERGISPESAGRFQALEGRIRALRDDLYRDLLEGRGRTVGT